jgi:uncharacterized protein (DUF924 family)
MSTPEEILAFWLDEIEQKDWYVASDELDATIRDRFMDTWEQAKSGAFSLWLTYPSGCLAYIILTDQFSRNMFRGKPEAFSTDRYALAVSKIAANKGWDMKIDEPARQFFYMPMMHSECITDQERCIRMMLTRMPETGESSLLHAQAHREVIRKFGRFPFRNEALARRDTSLETDFMQKGGYGAIVEELRA